MSNKSVRMNILYIRQVGLIKTADNEKHQCKYITANCIDKLPGYRYLHISLKIVSDFSLNCKKYINLVNFKDIWEYHSVSIKIFFG